MNKKDRELIKLGRMLRDFAELGVISRKELLWVSFLRGVAGGFGAIVGGTLLVAVLLWILGQFDQIPLVGDAVKAISESLRN
jgi:hypothetical protein